MPPGNDRNEMRLNAYASQAVPFQFNGSETNEGRGFTDTNGVKGEAWIPDAVGARIETDFNVGKTGSESRFTLVAETLGGNLAARMHSLGLKGKLSNEKGTFGLHFPELSASFQSDGFHMKAGFCGTPYTQEVAYLNSDLAIVSHSYAWDHLPFGATEFQVGGGDGKHFDMTFHVNAGGDRFFNAMASGNVIGGMWVTVTPTKTWKLVARSDGGEKEGESIGIMEFLTVWQATEKWTASLNWLSVWDVVVNDDRTKKEIHWLSLMAPVTFTPTEALKLTFRPEWFREESGTSHLGMTLGLLYALQDQGARFGLELRNDTLRVRKDNQSHQFTVAFLADISYLLRKSW